ncbi:chloramphenicol-sensitive protein RarD [Microbacterium keratanolyticum]|uniref:Permease n=1 Tax=Microbacterium keratanolyticum TaxID=67574 RepID=A0A9W6HR83_9MICO|nr:EamA family transporter RarD [Microbacterium keratanolyticum]MBM7469326.1 chloramphenicol-sensitive protein RarD [Microbacterium keratanolyticum]GLK01407.1 permease [Microbacterium keratanolyticum]
MSEFAPRARLGVIASVLSSTIFGVVFILSASLDFTGNVFFGWRIVFAVALLLGFLGITRRLPALRGLLRRLRGNPRLILAIMLSSAMLGFQQWLFTWAPGEGRGLPLALGYLVMPIALALTGRLLFRERLGPWRIAAVSVAAVGVGYQVWQFGALSWETLAVALGYPIYFAVRRFARIEGSAGLTAEMILILPVALALLLIDDPTLATLRDPGSALSLSLFAVLGAGALALYIGASQLLPLSLFGMLSYLEPVLLIVAATVVLAEPLSVQELPTYAAIALALVLLAGEGLRRRGPKTSL